MLSSLGAIETSNPRAIVFDPTNLKPHLPYHIEFHIAVAYTTKSFTRNIFCTVVDEGTSTCIMSLTCWKAIGQPIFSPSRTILTTFDGHSFWPHGIVPCFPVQLGGRTVLVVEPDYLLIQRSLLSAVFIPHEVFTPQKYVHSSTRGSAEGGYPLCGVRGAYPPSWG